MAKYFAGGHLRFVNGEWRDDDGNLIEIAPVRHGRWLDQIWTNKCSLCRVHQIGISPYCPNCGAKMDLSDECKQDGER